MNAAGSFEELLNLEVNLTALLLLLWGAAGYNAGRTAGRRTLRAVRAGARRGLIYQGLGTVVVLAKITLVAVTSTRGWSFVADRVLVAVPMLLVALVAVTIWSLPRLLRLARLPRAAKGVPTRPGVRRYAASPWLVGPVHAAALAAAFGLWLGLFAPLPRPLTFPALGAWGAWLLLVGLLAARQVQRARTLTGPRAATVLRPARRTLRAATVLVTAVALIVGGLSWAAAASRLPDHLPTAEHAGAGGHGSTHALGSGTQAAAAAPVVDVTDLVEPDTAAPDQRITLTAQDTRIRLASGRVVDGYTFNGQAPGPTIRARQGDLLEVTLVNATRAQGVTVHWHGIDVPNAADGVPGVTQDAVAPGGRFVYRFRVHEVGTHWYHTHQDATGAVAAGLFGPLIIEPAAGPPPPAHEIVVPMHAWPVDGERVPAFGLADQLDRRAVPAGTPVRLRLIDTDVLPRRVVLDGTPFRVTALDGNPVNEPGELSGQLLSLGSGGRMDLEFVMPDRPVRLTHVFDPDGGLLLSPDGTGEVEPDFDRPDFDMTTYGAPAPTPFGPDSVFDGEHTQFFDSSPGFYDGRFTFLWTTNGQVFPDLPPIVVTEGDLVKVRFTNRSRFDHPMHLHGHKMLVLSRGGRPVTGSPLWLDTLDVDVGEEWEIAFRADNPGVWMDHCHNFLHAEVGMMMHVTYTGVRSPFAVGHATDNNPA